MTLLITRRDIASLLDMRTCIDAVEDALRTHADPATFSQGVLGTHVDAGGFHVKTAATNGRLNFYVAKINANFPGNPRQWDLPTVQGVLILFDTTNGTPLAIMDSMEITTLRTAAASAVAAKHLSRTDSRTLAIIGCGVQGRSHLFALTAVRSFKRVLVHDSDSRRGEAFACELSIAIGIDMESVASPSEAARVSDVVVTCTPGHNQILSEGDLRPGTFLAAVGADSDSKRELHPGLLASSAVIADSIEQCAAIGELHHALSADLMSRSDVRAELGQVVSGARQGRLSEKETIIYDSTGIALQDVAAAAVVYERALAAGMGQRISLSA